MRSVQCPSCGASAQNHKNCEYCGSIFVRAYDVEYDLSDFSIESIEKFSFPGLKEELDYNLNLRKKYNCDSFVTEIYPSKSHWLDLITDDGLFQIINMSWDGVPDLELLSINLNRSLLTQNQIFKLQNIKEYKFFHYEMPTENNPGWWIIDFKSDTIAAAYFISKLLIEVFGINNKQIYFTTCVSNLVNESSDDDKWWIEEASEELKDRYNRAATKFGYYTRNDDGSYNKPDSINEEKKGNCFIATATMGDYDNPIVMDLRNFRDNWILKQNWGMNFVNFYYKYGQYAASFIEKKEFRKKISYYLIIKPLHIITKYL